MEKRKKFAFMNEMRNSWQQWGCITKQYKRLVIEFSDNFSIEITNSDNFSASKRFTTDAIC